MERKDIVRDLKHNSSMLFAMFRIANSGQTAELQRMTKVFIPETVQNIEAAMNRISELERKIEEIEKGECVV